MRDIWRWTKDQRHNPKSQLIAFLLVVAATGGSLYITTQGDLQREHKAQFRNCVRVQDLRDQANGTNFLIYDTFKLIRDQQDAAIKSGRLTGAALVQAKQSRKRAQRVVDTAVITGPTDCKKATRDPGRYVSPAPEFIKSDSDQVKISRKLAKDLIEKAKRNELAKDLIERNEPLRRNTP